jgi:hypothetical protein
MAASAPQGFFLACDPQTRLLGSISFGPGAPLKMSENSDQGRANVACASRYRADGGVREFKHYEKARSPGLLPTKSTDFSSIWSPTLTV